MTQILKLWKKAEVLPSKSATNEFFKHFLTTYSWFVYCIAGTLILCCIYFYVHTWKRRMEHRRQRRELQRANERIPQRRRPGAIYRDREIFRNALKTVQQYLPLRERKEPNTPTHHLKRTRSGAIYGR